jgi:hypothetical protein
MELTALITTFFLLLTGQFGVTVHQPVTTKTPVSLSLTVPHSKENDVACLGVNEKPDYKGFPDSFLAFVCWNVNLSDFPDIPEQFDQTLFPIEVAGTYYAGAVLYLKSPYPGAPRPEPKTVPFVPFNVTEAK